MEDFDSQIRELQAAERIREKTIPGSWTSLHTTVKELTGTITQVETRAERLERNIERVDLAVQDTGRHLHYRVGALQPLPERVDGLETKLEELEHDMSARLGEVIDLIHNETTQRNQVTDVLELRTGQQSKNMDNVERRLEKTMEKTMEKMEERDGMLSDRFDQRIELALANLQIDIDKMPWVRDFEQRDKDRQAEIQRSLAERPTMDQVQNAYTSNNVTEKMIQQLAQIQIRSDEQQQSLRAGLYTVERLLLQQLAGIVSLIITQRNVIN
jgi:hypothetical protein